VADVDMLSLQEQNILLWLAEAEIGVAEPLAVAVADLPARLMGAAVDHLVRSGLLRRELTVLDHNGSSLSVALTGEGAQVVVELWRRRLRELPQARLTA
jgi:hypothetical protein